ncbi:MAG TPA: acyl--CoA ligase [Alphaproteobacteria bacterium]|nr:acyl--CoA ligase [Alphaproteobacteria bacterium]
MQKHTVLRDVLAFGADDAVAIAAPASKPMTFKRLRRQIEETAQALSAFGAGSQDRVAIVLPNGPEMAAAFLSVASHAASAPLNPSYKAEEFEFYLSDLGAKLLIVEAGSTSPSIEVAKKLGVKIVSLTPDPDRGAGSFTLAGEEGGGPPVRREQASGDTIALVLHTSGTTSRPKIVPLSQRNLCASAWNISQTLRLTASDRCLSMMPLFHIHGLIATVLASVAAGGSVFCTPGFHAFHFFAWLSETKPTWYSAVPTMHQALLSRARHNEPAVRANPLRFIRSSSASLPRQVLAELEAAFTAPVIESYGMTEATHQMASNLLPPGSRKPGKVGVAAGPEVAIMDEAGNLLPVNATGEVVIRGDNVTAGYENNPKANAEAFAHGWFHTGDQGVLDDDGYLTITGRLKEIINRGGEKVSPAEVDDVLMDHPAIQQALTFGLPHDKLGEEVAAAVVLREGACATEREIRDFVASRIADFKAPRKVVFLNEIPKGATGKLQRVGLAKKLGLTG